MSALHPHIRALRALSTAYATRADMAAADGEASLAAIVREHSFAFFMAATELEAEDREREARIISIPRGH